MRIAKHRMTAISTSPKRHLADCGMKPVRADAAQSRPLGLTFRMTKPNACWVVRAFLDPALCSIPDRSCQTFQILCVRQAGTDHLVRQRRNIPSCRSRRTSRRGRFSLRPTLKIASTVGVDRVRCKNCDTDQAKDGCREVDHSSASCPPIAARYLQRD